MRTLCNDIGASLGCGACMSSLRRISAGAFSVESAHSIDEVENAANEGQLVDIMLPVDTLFSALPELKVPESRANRLKTGNIIKFPLPTAIIEFIPIPANFCWSARPKTEN